MALDGGAEARPPMDDPPYYEPAQQEPTQEQPGNQPAIEPERTAPPILQVDPTEQEHDGADTADGGDKVGDYALWWDTPAQWLMAITGVAAFGLSAWAVWLLRQTLVASREAVEVTAKGAQAALEANEIMREERRSWITFSIEPAGAFEVSGAAFKFEIKVDLRHIGQRPATNVAVHHKIVTGSLYSAYNSSLTDFVDRIFGRGMHKAKGRVIFPGDSMAMDSQIGTKIIDDSTGSVIMPEEVGTLFFMYCVTYRGVGIDTYYHTAQIYEIDRTPDSTFGWRLLRYSQAQSIS